VQAVLSGPPFLSRPTEGDIEIIKTLVAKRVNPEAFAAREAALNALADAKKGTRNALNKIRERASPPREAVNGGVIALAYRTRPQSAGRTKGAGGAMLQPLPISQRLSDSLRPTCDSNVRALCARSRG
jgi:hypothetical protein